MHEGNVFIILVCVDACVVRGTVRGTTRLWLTDIYMTYDVFIILYRSYLPLGIGKNLFLPTVPGPRNCSEGY